MSETGPRLLLRSGSMGAAPPEWIPPFAKALEAGFDGERFAGRAGADGV